MDGDSLVSGGRSHRTAGTTDSLINSSGDEQIDSRLSLRVRSHAAQSADTHEGADSRGDVSISLVRRGVASVDHSNRSYRADIG